MFLSATILPIKLSQNIIRGYETFIFDLSVAVECQDNRPKPSSKSQEPLKNCENWGLANDQENSPFKSPWEGVISTSLQRERNDSTQVVPSSTTNNEGLKWFFTVGSIKNA